MGKKHTHATSFWDATWYLTSKWRISDIKPGLWQETTWLHNLPLCLPEFCQALKWEYLWWLPFSMILSLSWATSETCMFRQLVQKRCRPLWVLSQGTRQIQHHMQLSEDTLQDAWNQWDTWLVRRTQIYGQIQESDQKMGCSIAPNYCVMWMTFFGSTTMQMPFFRKLH